MFRFRARADATKSNPFSKTSHPSDFGCRLLELLDKNEGRGLGSASPNDFGIDGFSGQGFDGRECGQNVRRLPRKRVTKINLLGNPFLGKSKINIRDIKCTPNAKFLLCAFCQRLVVEYLATFYSMCQILLFKKSWISFLAMLCI